MFGIDSYVLRPPFGAVVSLLLLAGCDRIGLSMLRALNLCATGGPRWQRWQAPVVGAMAVATVVYPLALLDLTSLAMMRALAAAMGVVGLAHLLNSVWASRQRHGREDLAEIRTAWISYGLLLLILAGATLMSLAPPTDADSLDYHLGVPVALLLRGGMPVTPEWLHGRLGSSHEVLNAIGLAGGSDNFGAVLQVAGLISITALLLFADSAESERPAQLRRRARLIAALVVVSAPVMVSLIAQKPQLMPAAMTSLALALVIYPSRRALTTRDALFGHALVCFLTLSAAQAKLSFMLTGGVVGLLSLVALARRGLLIQGVGIGVAATALMLLPAALWKQHYFHDSLINSLFNPMPGAWPGGGSFDDHLRGAYMRNVVPFPIQLLVPLRPTLISIVFGPVLAIALLALRPGRDGWLWLTAGAAVVVSVVLAKFGPLIARYYIEPSVWMMMILALEPKPPLFIDKPWFGGVVAAQAVLTVGLFWFGAAILFPGALTPRWRSSVMDKYANGYRIMKWADSVLPRDAVLLSADRSVALAPRDVVSFDWAAVVPVKSRTAVPYLNRLKERGVTHVLMGTAPRYTSIAGCLGPAMAGPGDDPVAVRNPFAGPRSYPEWIYPLNTDQLPDCAIAAQ